MNFKPLLPHLAAIAIFFLTSFALFAPEFQGKGIRRGDIAAYQGSAQESKEYQESEGRRMLWTGTSFGGMPTYQISAVNDGNLLYSVVRLSRGYLKGQAGIFFSGLLCAYLCLIIIGVNPWLSIAAAIATGMATNNMVLWKAGHQTKTTVIYYLPLVLGGIVATFQRKYLVGGLVFALGMGLAILSNHPQMLLYFGLTVPIFGLVKLVQAVRKKDFKHFGIAVGALVLGLVLAIGAGASNILPTKEYTDATMRGGQVLETPVAASSSGSSAKGNGLDFEYAMQWSNGFKDALATYIPLAAGGGSGQVVAGDSAFGKGMRKAGFQVRKEVAAPLYHGSLPFTEGPIYLGAVVWALFIFGLFNARKALAIWIGVGTLFIMMIAAGSNLHGFNEFLFNNVPLLNKFRTPNSALSVSALMMIALGIIGVHDWLKRLDTKPEKARKGLLYSGITAAALGVFFTLIYPSIMSFETAQDAALLNRFTGGQIDANLLLGPLVETRQEVYSADAWRSFLFVGLTFGTLFLFFKKTITPLIGGLILAALLAVDFNGINGRYITDKIWVKAAAVKVPYQPSAADQQILQDKDASFRVLNLTVNPWADASTSYFHKSVGGYSAVKMRRYQDLIDGYLTPRDQDVLNMLNTKYFIVPNQDRQPEARQNPGAYGPAWLVSTIKSVGSNDEEFKALGEVADLKATAIVHQEFSDEISGLNPRGAGTISLTNYVPDELTYSFNSTAEELAVFSEMWYGPDLGWKAYIDGQEAPLIRSNYILRALRVPAGQHEIKMVFEPSSYATGKTISLISSLIILFGLIGFVTYRFLQSRKVKATATPVSAMEEGRG